MKKLLSLSAVLLLASTALFGQVLPATGVKNTLSASFGRPYGQTNDSDREGVKFYGFVNTLQARVDISKFTIDGMINWGALTSWSYSEYADFYFANTRITPFYYTNCLNQGGWWTNGITDQTYINFLVHPTKGFDIGIGTRLNWKVGPAPNSAGYFWDSTAHIIQGGLKDAVPGGADVAGYTYYANSYTSHYASNSHAAIAARYKYKDVLEIGAAIPDGATTSNVLFNVGASVHPVDFLTASFAYDGLLSANGNMYVGANVSFTKDISLDAYLGFNFRKDSETGRWGTGAILNLGLPKFGITIKPEADFTFYNDSKYTFASCFGGKLDWALTKTISLGAWTSFAWGAYNNEWKDSAETKDYTGGFVFDLRPDITWSVNANHSLAAFVDIQARTAYNNTSYNTWASGIFWVYKTNK